MWLKAHNSSYVNLKGVTMAKVQKNAIAELFGHANNGQAISFGMVEGPAYNKLLEALAKEKWVNIGSANTGVESYFFNLNKCSKIDFITDEGGKETVRAYMNGNEPAYNFSDRRAVEAIRVALS